MSGKKLLIIDDEKDFCMIIKENLELRGNYSVDVAFDGREGIRLARIIKPGLILLDIRMPEMDGFEVLEKLKESPDTIAIPVIMLSALDDDDSKIKGAQLYDELYITKPVRIVDLLAKIDEILQRRGTSTQRRRT